jgi:hypothetical protein
MAFFVGFYGLWLAGMDWRSIFAPMAVKNQAGSNCDTIIT